MPPILRRHLDELIFVLADLARADDSRQLRLALAMVTAADEALTELHEQKRSSSSARPRR